LLPVRFSEQILPGTFEYALNWLVDHEIALSVFDARYRNDETGASAYHPGVLLKVVLLGYARELTSSRSIERACRENIVFMALALKARKPSARAARSVCSACGRRISARIDKSPSLMAARPKTYTRKPLR
jgi:hypothetical protein